MRVISGTARGTKLRTLDLPHLRPMLDRVKESLFNIIRADVEGARVLDLFSGCGALGIESLSRGAKSCVFVEKDGRLTDLLAQNVKKCRMPEQCEIMQSNFFSLSARRPPEGMLPADLVFIDPPYVFVEDPNQRAELFTALEGMAGQWVGVGALMMLHHFPLPHAVWPTRLMECTDRRVYGKSQITLFEMCEDAKHDCA